MNHRRYILICIGILVAMVAFKAVGQACTSFTGFTVDASTGDRFPGAQIRVAVLMLTWVYGILAPITPITEGR